MAVKYLVTGATGNLGNRIVRRLAAQGKNVRALVLPGDKGASRIPAGVEIYEGNILDRETLKSFFEVPNGTEIIVIHSAGIVATAKRPDSTRTGSLDFMARQKPWRPGSSWTPSGTKGLMPR